MFSDKVFILINRMVKKVYEHVFSQQNISIDVIMDIMITQSRLMKLDKSTVAAVPAVSRYGKKSAAPRVSPRADDTPAVGAGTCTHVTSNRTIHVFFSKHVLSYLINYFHPCFVSVFCQKKIIALHVNVN